MTPPRAPVILTFMRPRLILPALVGVLFLGGCGHVYLDSESYAPGSAVEINGAQVRSTVKPNGGEGGFAFSAMVYTAGSGSLDGPFLWRVEATGQEGVHQGLIVHRLKVTTEKTARSEWYPSRYLGIEVPFKPVPGRKGETFAKFRIPGELEVYPEKDGRIRIYTEVSVRTGQGSERQIARFELTPESSEGIETLNVPAELVKSFGGRDPAEWELGGTALDGW